MNAHIILYVKDQKKSTDFYSHVLDLAPVLNVPGMSEFKINEGCILGLMPEIGIKKLLGDILPNPEKASGIPRAEVYLRVQNPDQFHQRALKMGAKELSPLQKRDWGDNAAYSLDLDGHVLAFAESSLQ